MKLAEIPFKSSTDCDFLAELDQLTGNFSRCEEWPKAVTALRAIALFHQEFQSQWALSFVRLVTGAEDRDYRREYKAFNELGPKFESKLAIFYRELTSHPFRKYLSRFGQSERFFKLAGAVALTHHPDLIALQQAENLCRQEYREKFMQAKIQFEGESVSVISLRYQQPFLPREKRKRVMEEVEAWYQTNQSESRALIRKLVRLRQQQAAVLEMPDYLPLGHTSHRRTDIDPKKIAAFRQGLATHFGPVAKKIRKIQARQLGLESPEVYDRNVFFENWSPKIEEGAASQTALLSAALGEISPEAADLFAELTEKDLIYAGGTKGGNSFALSLPTARVPFVNLLVELNNPLSVNTFFHEFGHAWQNRQSMKWWPYYEYIHPPTEAAEIFSYAMEFFSWQGLHHIYQPEDLLKVKILHLCISVGKMLACMRIDEFEEYIYQHPEASEEEWDQKWQAQNIPTGAEPNDEPVPPVRRWEQITALALHPLYVISYPLAMICGLNLLERSQTDPQEAWEAFDKMANAGGSLSFSELCDLGGIPSPFESDSIARTADFVLKQLEELEGQIS